MSNAAPKRQTNHPSRRRSEGTEKGGRLWSFPSDWSQLKGLLASPVSGASLAVFRIALGLVMALEAWSLLRPDPAAISMGTSPLATYYAGPDIQFHFPYEPFAWLPLLPPIGMYLLVGLLALAGICMALGLFYRVSAALVFLCWGYFFAVESTRSYWQSHYYIELLSCFLMVWMPGAACWSLDAWRKKAASGPASQAIPFWPVFLLRGQLVIAYFYAGVSKINADWLLDAVPVRWFLARPSVTAPYEPYLSAVQLESLKAFITHPTFAYFISYTGLVFDLAVGFLLLIRRTRIFALLSMIVFHATNHLLIFDDIGWFPLVGAATALIFLDPDWPERFARWVRRPRISAPDWKWFGAGLALFPPVGATLGWKLAPTDADGSTGSAGRFRLPGWVPAFVAGWLVWQSLMPLRHYAIPGDGRFTYEGLSFSWRLKADVHHALFLQMFLQDPKILTPGAGVVRTRIDWTQFRGEPVIYRKTTPARVQWSQMPELLVVLESPVGERVIYNPHAGRDQPRTEAESRERIARLWRDLYGRQPVTVPATLPLPQLLAQTAGELAVLNETNAAGRLSGLARQLAESPTSQTAALCGEAHSIFEDLDERGRLTGRLREAVNLLPPFSLEFWTPSPEPFLVIHDPEVVDEVKAQIRRAAWRPGGPTRAPREPLDSHTGGDPVIVYTGELGFSARKWLPQVAVLDALDHPDVPAYLSWNCLKDLTDSKFIHISNQAFYLRRYARRVARLWEESHGRRPSVQAIAMVSYNGRPHQLLVDPGADLASVGVRWLAHNQWIKDLETLRVPREALDNGQGLVGD